MSHILHLDSSPRAERSLSRTLSHEFVKAWQEAHSDDTVTYRDLGHQAIPHVSEPWVAAAFSAPADRTPELQAAISCSDELVDELLAADRYVMGIPLYNLSVPSIFKAYIDQIVRVGRTFAIDASGAYTGLVKNKKMLVITSQGGYYRPGSEAEAYNFHEPYLRTIFGFIGVTDISFIYADGLAMGEEARDKSVAAARAEIHTKIATW
jgi:FMN-dependent NADH-azoreductase